MALSYLPYLTLQIRMVTNYNYHQVQDKTRQTVSYKVTLRGVRVTIVAVEKQYVINIVCSCILSLAIQHAMGMRRSGRARSAICLRITSQTARFSGKNFWGTRLRSWIIYCATSWKVAGSIPDGVIGIFHWHNPSGRTMALESTQPLTEMTTRVISLGGGGGGKGDRCVGLTTLPLSCADCLEIWEPQPPGDLTACPGLLPGVFKRELC
jgi:hypothetical protein